MNPDVVLVVSRTSEGLHTAILRADVGTFPGVGPDVNLTDVRCRKGTLATFKRALKGALS